MPSADLAGDARRRLRVRRSALGWALLAAAFYFGFIVLTLLRGAK